MTLEEAISESSFSETVRLDRVKDWVGGDKMKVAVPLLILKMCLNGKSSNRRAAGEMGEGLVKSSEKVSKIYEWLFSIHMHVLTIAFMFYTSIDYLESLE